MQRKISTAIIPWQLMTTMGGSPIEEVRRAGADEVGYMESTGTWHLVPSLEAWEKDRETSSVRQRGGYQQGK